MAFSIEQNTNRSRTTVSVLRLRKSHRWVQIERKVGKLFYGGDLYSGTNYPAKKASCYNITIMLIDYLHWQFVLSPNWLIKLLWNIERATIRFFSINLMLRTLLAYWHKDAMAFTGGSLSKLATTILWNTISRLIGFIIRLTVIAIWLAIQTIFIPLSLVVLAVLVLWPLLVIVGLAIGVSTLLI